MSYSPKSGLIYVSGMSGGHWIRRGVDPLFLHATQRAGHEELWHSGGAGQHERQDRAWQKKITYPAAFGSGTTVTAGDLLFHGEPDGQFQVYNAKTGDMAWQFQTGGPATAPAITYEVGGKQYVAHRRDQQNLELRAWR